MTILYNSVDDENGDIKRFLFIVENASDCISIIQKYKGKGPCMIKCLKKDSGYLFNKIININVIPEIVYNEEIGINILETTQDKEKVILCCRHRNVYGLKTSIVPNKLWSIKENKIIKKDFLEEIHIDEGGISYMIVSYRWGTLEIPTDNYIPKSFQTIIDIAKIFGINLIWIDQLCISQNNEIEKEKEIQNMRYYYKSAQIVSVILPDIGNETLRNLDIKKIKTENIPISNIISEISNNIKISNKALIDFANSEWFTRAWTLQEGLLNTNTIFFSKYFTKDNKDCILSIHQIKKIIISNKYDQIEKNIENKMIRSKFIPTKMKKYIENIENEDMPYDISRSNLSEYIKYNEYCGTINEDNFLPIGKVLSLLKNRKSSKSEDMIYSGMALCINGKTMKYIPNVTYEEALKNACISAGRCSDWSWLLGSFNSYPGNTFIPHKWHKLLLNNFFDDYPILKCIIKYNKLNSELNIYGCPTYKIDKKNIFYIENFEYYSFENIINQFNNYYINAKNDYNINKVFLHNLQGFNSLEEIDIKRLESIITQKNYIIYDHITNRLIPKLFTKLINQKYILTGIIIFKNLFFILLPKEDISIVLKNGVTILFPYGENSKIGIICIGSYENLKRVGTFEGEIKNIISDTWKINVK